MKNFRADDPTGQPVGSSNGPAECVETLQTADGVEDAYGRYRAELLGFAVNSLSDRELAEEVVQETFVRAWKAADRFDPRRGSLRTWLFAIARNGIVDAARRRAVRSGVRPASLEERVKDDPVEQLLLNIQVSEALQRLTPEHRQTVIEVHYFGRTCADLAGELGIPAATVRSRLYYGLRTLRSILEKNGWLAE